VKLHMEVSEAWRPLRRPQKRRIQKSAKYSKDARYRIRCLIVLNWTNGSSPTQISRILGCSRSLVYQVAHRFIDDGLAGLVDKREDNGGGKADESIGAFCLKLVDKLPSDFGYARPTWTLELLVRVISSKLGVAISKGHLSKVARRVGLRYRRAKPIVLCPWKKRRRTRRLREIEKLIEELPDGEIVLYVDEVDIDLNPKIGPDWCRCGVQKTVRTPGQNAKRYLAGALNAKTGELTWVEGDKKDSDLFIDQLWTLVLDDYPNATRIHLVLDNYGIHSSKRTQIAIDALADKIDLHFLPPYCPDHNRIERVWKDLHDNVTRNHRCTTMTQLMKEVRRYLRIRKSKAQHEYAQAT